MFTTATGGLLLRQTVTKAVTAAAERAGIDPKGLGTHGGRSTAITALYAEEGLDLADVARHVGHANPMTTAGYVPPPRPPPDHHHPSRQPPPGP